MKNCKSEKIQQTFVYSRESYGDDRGLMVEIGSMNREMILDVIVLLSLLCMLRKIMNDGK